MSSKSQLFYLKFAAISESLLVMTVNAVEMGSGESNQGSDPVFTVENVLMSVALLCTIVLVAVGCTTAVWRRIFCFWRTQGPSEAPPDLYPGGRSSSFGGYEFESLDASNLQRGRGGRESVTIEPLPTLDSLGLGDGRDSIELRTFRSPGIVPSAVASSSQGAVESWLQHPEAGFPRQSLEYHKILGKGWFGKVVEGEAVNIKQYVPASCVIVRELRNDATPQEQQQFLHEARMFRVAQQQRGEVAGTENILKMLGFCIEQMPYILIFENYPLGDLKTYLKTRAKQAPAALKPGDDGILIRMILDVIRGVKWMKHTGFVHGDLAARNCLVATSAGKIMIGDYGCSPQKHRADYFWTGNQAIPVRWAAPETLTFDDSGDAPSTSVMIHEITHEANIWSLAVLFWEIFQLGKMPYENLTDEDVVRRVVKQGYILEPPQLSFVNQSTKEKIYQLMVSCWNSSPEYRPTIDVIEEAFATPS